MALIAIDGRKYLDFGIGTYIQELAKALSSLHPPHEFILYAMPSDVNTISLPDGWRLIVADYPKYSLSEIAFFGFRAKRKGVAVFHEPHYTLPLGVSDISVVTIHDIIHLRFPGIFSRAQRVYARSMIWHSLKHSRIVSVDSQFTKKDILRTFPINPDKISVVHLGVGDQFQPMRDSGTVQDFKLRFGVVRPFILYVGNVKPHKGLDVLLNAFARIRKSVDLDLVTIGGTVEDSEPLKTLSRELNIRGYLKELGRVKGKDLVAAYNAAEVLVMPSRYEGFGLPALEAMACGTPAVVTNAGSLPEVMGDAALVVDVGNERELADRILLLLRDSSLRREQIEKGRKRCKEFTWAKTAAQTLRMYEQVINQ